MNNLKNLRKAKGLTQKEVAQFIGISQNNYSYWENGKVKIDNASLQKLADFFGVSIDNLLGREVKTNLTTQPNPTLIVPEKYRDVLIACNDGAEDLTQEDIDAIVRFIEFTKNSKKK